MPALSPVMPVSASPHHDVAGQRHMRASFASASRLRWAVAASRTVARIPVTVGVLALVLSMGIYTGTLWHAADAVSDVLTPLSFGTPRLQDGRPWTFAIGAFVQSGPEWYVLAVTLCIGLAAYEKRIGSLRTAVTLFGTQLAATLVTAALLWPRINESWAWAASLAHQVDVGISAGVLGVLGASTAIISHSWRRGVRLCALAYLSVMVLRSGLLPDVEQLLAFGSGVLLGPILAGRPPLPMRSPRPGGLEARLVASALVASMAVGNLVDAIHPGIGGVFGAGLTTHPPMHGFALIIGELAVGLLVADALRRGR